MDFLLIQGIGAIGYSLLAWSYFKKEKMQILLLEIFAYIFFTIHFFLLNGITGGICNLIGLVALVIIYMFEKYKIKGIKTISYIFVILVIIINIITFQNIFSIFPMIASSIVILSFLVDNEDIIRGVGFISAVCWLIYAIVVYSYISIIYEIVTLVGVGIAFIKNTKNPKLRIKS